MFNNRSASSLFVEICDAFFREERDYYVRYYDCEGQFQLSNRARNVVPTYMVYDTAGEVVVADTGLDIMSHAHNDNLSNDIEISFEDSDRIRKIGVLFQQKGARFLYVKWIAIEDSEGLKSVHANRDLHKDLSLIAKRIGVKEHKVRFG